VKKSNYEIPGQVTTYHSICEDVSVLVNDANVSQPIHIVGFEPLIPENTARNVHHMQLHSFGGTGTVQRSLADKEACANGYCGETCKPSAALDDGGVVFPWARGVGSLRVPEEAGFRLFGDGIRSVSLITHYDNPKREKGLIDNSGVRVYYTKHLREHDIGFMLVGDPNLIERGETIPKGLSNHTFSCSGITQDFVDPEVTIFIRGFHMHSNGARMESRLYRDGEQVRRDWVDFWDFKMASGLPLTSTGAGFKVKRGDTFEIDCSYEAKAGAVKFGHGTNEEMP